MKWVEFSINVPANQVEKVTSILNQYGRGGSIVEEWESEATHEKSYVIKIYTGNDSHLKEIRQQIIQAFIQNGYPSPTSLREQILRSEDWFESLKKHFGILEIGERFIIKPSWIDQVIPDSTRMVIEIDPGAAFGTGLHPTTRLCLNRLEKTLIPGMQVFDLGTGTGILAIVSAKLGASSVFGLDIDPVAVRVAQANVKSNSVDPTVRIERGTLSQKVQKENLHAFDVVTANIFAKTIIDLADGFYNILKPGGILIVSGIQIQTMDEVMIRLSMADFKVEGIDRQDEWCVIIFSKPH